MWHLEGPTEYRKQPKTTENYFIPNTENNQNYRKLLNVGSS